MKRRIISGGMAVCLVLSLTACKGNSLIPGREAEEFMDGSDAASGKSDSPETETKAPGAFKIGLVMDAGGINDGSFNQSVWEGLVRAQDELGIQAEYLVSETEEDYFPNLETFVNGGYDLIICAGYLLADTMALEAQSNPEVKFAIIDYSGVNLPNVSSLMFEQAQASYLAGYVAGITTKTNNVGIVLGMATDSMHEFGYGYLAGVMDANPQAVVQQANANSFADPKAGKDAAAGMIAGGADVIFHAAGGTGLGVIEACQESGIWAIGADSDQSQVAPETILTSAMKRVDNACFDEAKAVVQGEFTSGIKIYSLEDAGVDIAPTTSNLSEETLKAVEDVKAKIISREISVPENKAEFEARYGTVYTLD